MDTTGVSVSDGRESPPTLRLTSLTHSGGCGCKLPSSVLHQIVAKSAALEPFSSLLVGVGTSDDAAVYKIDDERAIVATTDFFTPIVDDPLDFGRIAAANALSDIYAMGGKPLLALAIVGMPIKKLDVTTIGTILEGGASICSAAGIPIAGGHSIDAPEPIYGLAVIGVVGCDRILRNDGAQHGDVAVLTKPIGVGV
jgi:selenide, water dikinase